MPEYAMWSLIVALIILALGLALKVAQLTHRLGEVKDKSASAETVFKTSQDTKNKEIADIKKLNDTIVSELNKKITELSHSQPPKSITKDFPINKLIWSATKYSDIGLRVDDCPRCEQHELKLLHDSNFYYCPESLNNNCQIKFPLLSLRSMKEFATSYIDREFRDEFK
jgi:hypothetical protein